MIKEIVGQFNMRIDSRFEPWFFPGGSNSKESACNAGDSCSTLGQEDSLEKGMANHCSILAWRIPWTEEPTEAGYSNVVAKSETRLNTAQDIIETGELERAW